MAPTIILRPGSGLCNRIRSIGSAIKLSKEIGCKLQVEWFRCPLRRWAGLCGMRVGYADLFKPIDGIKIIERIKVRNDFPWNWYNYSSINKFFYDEDRRHAFVDEIMNLKEGKRWLWTCYNFYDNVDYSWLRPKASIQRRIDDFADTMGDDCIGVHIRRTDNKAAIQASPLSLFIQKMDMELEANSKSTFFISSDDLSTKVELHRRYGDRVLFCTDVHPRYTVEGERDAVIDLMLLSRARKIYGSYWSSFSEVASHIGRNNLEVLTAKGVDLPSWEKN